MTKNEKSVIGLTGEQIEVFADGLYYFANLDGVHENEIQVIREFLNDVGRSDYIERLPAVEFSVERASRVLDTSYLRRLFLRACLVVCMSDHALTTAEEDALEFLASVLAIDTSLRELKAELEETPGATAGF